MLLSEIEEKDVVNVIDGSIIGSIVDLEIEPNSGQIYCIYIQLNIGFLNLFQRQNKVILGWDQIVKIGEDVIIVNYPYATTD